MPMDKIIVRGAQENNLKNIDVEFPRDKMVVFTGLSGSGKSSLAFDTIFAEGQRRYMESLSSYARMFMGQMSKPEVDSIEGLSPAISIDQKTTSKNPRSTVGTVTEIYDYLRLLYAHIGIPHCPVCGREIQQQTIDQIVDKVLAMDEGTKIQVMAPIIKAKKGTHAKELDSVRKSGFVRVRVDGNIYDLSEEIKLEKNIRHDIDVVVDRLVIKPEIRSRLADSLETASRLTSGISLVSVVGGEDILFAQNDACPEHGISMDELTPRMFSFNSPQGACEHCTGLGIFMKVNPDLVIPDRSVSLRKGAIHASGWYTTDDNSIAMMYFKGLGKAFGFTLDTPINKMSEEAVNAILYGTGDRELEFTRTSTMGRSKFKGKFEGVIPNLERRYSETQSSWSRHDIETLMTEVPCDFCKGDRLKPEILSVTVGGLNIAEFCKLSVTEALEFLDNLALTEHEHFIADRILKEVRLRLGFLNNVGLEYLTLSRSSGTLSGGESQRIRLATQIGSYLTGVLYILDEPSIGLHQRDNDKLLATLQRLRDLGNTLIVVEHDEDTIRAADYVVDIGPGAGVHGGQVVFAGTVEDLIQCEDSITGQYLSGARKIPVPQTRRPGNGNWLTVRGAAENNLKHIDVSIPLGTLTCVTGVSGSGKSSLVNEIIYKRLACDLNRAKIVWGSHDGIEGVQYLDKIVEISQSPIGRTPRSNPATYTGVFTDIRDLFANLQESKMRGFDSGRFSFNKKGGRCEACEGDGIIQIEMHFLPDVYVPCEVCKGKRYNRETLEVKYKGKSISDVLDMTVEDGVSFFENHPKIVRKLKTLYDVGLGYIKIGQPATTLSGGEAQRVKLATELSKRATGKTIFVLDEPTTGLHTADVHRLIEVLQTLVDGGNTVLVIEHNLDVIKTADYIIDLGPEGGNRGGTIVAAGTPEEIAAVPESYTGHYLRALLSPSNK